MQAPPPEAPFAEKLAFYRSQHTSKGVKLTHLVGTPFIAFGMPLVFAKPRLGVPMFVGGWTLQIIGHRLFEKNTPSTHKGWITYQLTGMIDVCEGYGELLARRSRRRAARRLRVAPGEPLSAAEELGAVAA
jgi:hypothetical protein